MDGLCLKSGFHGVPPTISVEGPDAAAAAALEVRANISQVNAKPRFSLRIGYAMRSFWRGGAKSNSNNRNNVIAVEDTDTVLLENRENAETSTPLGNNWDWMLKILHLRSLWKVEKKSRSDGNGMDDKDDLAEVSSVVNNDDCEDKYGCDTCRVDDEDDEKGNEFDKNSFSRLLRKVSLAEAKLYAQMSYLGNIAYSIPKIKAGNLLQYSSLRYVTSSIDKRESSVEFGEGEGENKSNINVNLMNSDFAARMASTDSVTAVVSAEEEVKQAVADDLSSTRSSPCEWFICDNDHGTRYFVIQGSESLASWQANLLFEPVRFEGLDALVHRGIYEAAKGMYEQMLPEVRSHLTNHGKLAAFRFTGHSLGGSLSLLINLMLLIRKEVPASALLPVITFGAPSIMCGGDYLLRKLGLSRSHVQAITMHRDIVPRAFCCNYPKHVTKLLKAVNRNFRNHPCLNNQKLLYSQMGELVILQPDEKFSPHHHLLPSGSGLYFLSCPLSDTNKAEKLLQSAQSVFINSPHPLEILSDRSAYGSEGTIRRYHHMRSYLKSIRAVVRQELNYIRKSKREDRRKLWWSLLTPGAIIGGSVVLEKPQVSIKKSQNRFNFSGILHTGRESFKRFNRLVASQHMHLLVIVLFPAKLLLLGAYSLISIG